MARFWPSPRHNVLIACGPSSLVVLDLDTHGELPDQWRELPGVHDGRDVLAQLCEWAGEPWPSTYMIQTPSGGWHLYLPGTGGRRIRNSASLLGPMVDVRAQGGYVVGAGSAVGGSRTTCSTPTAPAPLPEWIYRLLPRRSEPARPALAQPRPGHARRAWSAPPRSAAGRASATTPCTGRRAAPSR